MSLYKWGSSFPLFISDKFWRVAIQILLKRIWSKSLVFPVPGTTHGQTCVDACVHWYLDRVGFVKNNFFLRNNQIFGFSNFYILVINYGTFLLYEIFLFLLFTIFSWIAKYSLCVSESGNNIFRNGYFIFETADEFDAGTRKSTTLFI